MRNQELTKMRNKRLVERFFQLHDVQHYRLNDVLMKLSREEFFLDTTYIYKLIFYRTDNFRYYEYLKETGQKNEIRTEETFSDNL